MLILIAGLFIVGAILISVGQGWTVVGLPLMGVAYAVWRLEAKRWKSARGRSR